MTKMYVVDSKSKYHLQLTRIDNIEDAGDDFMTEDDVREAFGLGENERINPYSPMIRRHLVVAALSELKASLIEKNKKSMIITDDDLVTFLATGHSASNFVEGLCRKGNRLSLHVKADKTTPTKRDMQNLIYSASRTISRKYGFEFEIKYAHNNYSGAVDMIKKIITVEEFEQDGRDRNITDWEDQLVWFKNIWENPTQFDEVV